MVFGVHLQRLFVAAVGLLAAGLFIVQVATARPLDDVIASGEITIFVYADYAPFSWKEDGEMTGIDVDIAKEIAKALGLRLQLLVRQADENVDDDLRVNIWKGDIVHRKAADVMLHVPFDRALEIRAESLAILFNPYFGEEIALAVDRAVLPYVETFARFVHKPIGVEVDTVSDFFLSNAFGGRLQQSVRRGRVFLEVAEMYRASEVSAIMGSRAQMEWVAMTTPNRNTAILQPPMQGIVRSAWPVGMAVKHDSRDLGYAIGDIISQLVSSGRLKDICSRYGVTYVAPQLN